MQIPVLMILVALQVGMVQVGQAEKRLTDPREQNSLHLMRGSTLGHELDEFKGPDYSPKNRRPPLTILFNNGAIASIRYEWEYDGGPYPNGGTVYHVFDLSKRSEVALWREIKPSEQRSFEKLLISRIQPQMDKHRKGYPSKDWEDLFRRGDDWDPHSMRGKFRVEKLSRFNSFYISEGSIHFVIHSYWGLPHVTQALEFSCDVPILFSEMNRFLIDSSVLKF